MKLKTMEQIQALDIPELQKEIIALYSQLGNIEQDGDLFTAHVLGHTFLINPNGSTTEL